jgi:exopolysaccharide biosynthesis polyprenyl glycosylphosphotransferase
VVPGLGDGRSGVETLVLLLVLPVLGHMQRRFGVYDSHRIDPRRNVVRGVVAAHVATFVVLLPVWFVTRPDALARDFPAFFAISMVTMVIGRWSVYLALQRLRQSGYDTRSVCVVCDRERAFELSRTFAERPEWGLSVSAACIREGDSRQFFEFGTFRPIGNTLESAMKELVIDEVLISVDPERLPGEVDIVRQCEQYGLVGRVVFPPREHDGPDPRIEDFHPTAALSVAKGRFTDRDLPLKRTFDIIMGSVCLTIAAPAMIVAAIAVKLSSPGPILFVQQRAGLNGRRFRMFKFRTMVDGAEIMVRHSSRSITQGPVFKDVADYRITSVGRILRRYSLDELPQLFNVIKGDMSMVGPRPLPLYEADQIQGASRRRFSVPPGLTCIWQVNGRSDVGFERWMQYDLQYVDGWSLWSDIVLIFRTIPAVLMGRGAY